MADFIIAALPWVIMGLSVAVAAARIYKGKTKKVSAVQDRAADGANVSEAGPDRRTDDPADGEADDTEKQGYGRDDYMLIGMCLGMCLGGLFGIVLDGRFRAYGVSLGMCVGMAVGSLIKKK
ncbi:MAG: hypothetical protein Q4D16_23375 [Eubacteriales bacterium]|nr:hypothetical protein [Eubacteriales bacterium]